MDNIGTEELASRLIIQARQVRRWLKDSPSERRTEQLQVLLRLLWANYDNIKLWEKILSRASVQVRRAERAKKTCSVGISKANDWIDYFNQIEEEEFIRLHREELGKRPFRASVNGFERRSR